MPGFGTEMRDVNHGGGVVRCHDQDVTGRQRLQPFTGLENGQGAQQPHRVEFMCIISHAGRDRRDVTCCPQTCDHMAGDARVKGR